MRFLFLFFIFVVQSAFSQDETPADAPSSEETGEETPATEAPAAEAVAAPAAPTAPVELASDMKAYNAGIALIDAGPTMFGQACSVFKSVANDFPGTEGARLAQEKIEWLGDAVCNGRLGGSAVDKERALLSAGRRELIITQAILWPAMMGAVIPGALGVDAPAINLAGGLAGLGIGIGGTIGLTSKHAVTPGQAMAIYTGQTLGIGHGIWISALATSDVQAAAAFSSVGFLLGTGGGIAAAVLIKPSAGDMALVRSTTVWAGYLSTMSLIFTQPNSGNAGLSQAGIGFDLGLITGIVLASMYDTSRARMNMINLAGYAGALGGLMIGGLYALAAADDGASLYVFGGVLTASTITGLILGTHLTRNMVGGKGGKGGMALINHSPEAGWSIGAATPMIAPTRQGDWKLSVPIMQGTF